MNLIQNRRLFFFYTGFFFCFFFVICLFTSLCLCIYHTVR